MLKDIQQERVVFSCEHCDGEIYKGNYFYEYDGCLFCDEDCVQEFVMEHVKSETSERVA